jgi:hypothetical protein
MKKLLVLCAGLMLVASVASAQIVKPAGKGLQLSWVNCFNVAGAVQDYAFLCDGGQVNNLNATLSVDVATPGVVAMDGILDLLFQSPSTPAFWQYQAGGCNDGGAVIVDAKPSAGCGALTLNTNTFCGTGGAGCDAFITAYAFGGSIGFPANRARLLVALARASTSPVTLALNTGQAAHFAFTLQFFEDNASEVGGACDGCLTGTSITWNSAILYNTAATTGGEGTAADIRSSDPGSIPNSFSNCSGCQTVSNKNRSWGQLKSLYR